MTIFFDFLKIGRLEKWGEWMRETLLLDVPHRQVVFTIHRMLRIFFKYNRKLLGELTQDQRAQGELDVSRRRRRGAAIGPSA